MEPEVNYKYKPLGRYEIRVVRNIIISKEGAYPWIHYDTANVQYLRFKTIEQAQSICFTLGIKEYEVEEYSSEDDDHMSSHSKTVYRTPIAQQAIDALLKKEEQRKLEDQLTRLENRQKLIEIPHYEVLKTFSTGHQFVRTVSTSEKQDKVFTELLLMGESEEKPVSSFWLDRYVTRGTHRFRKKKFVEDLVYYKIPEKEAIEFAQDFETIKKRQQELNNMKI